MLSLPGKPDILSSRALLNECRIELSRKTSPLLKLPTEVLQKILKCILGGRLIHVEYLEPSPDSDLDWFYSDDAMSSTHDADAGLPLGRGADTNVSDVQEILLQTTAKVGFRSTFCESQQSEREAYDEVKTGYESFPPDQDPEFYVAGWKQRHADCYRWRRPGGFELQAGHLERKVDLNVMGTCRQLYEECNVLLWGTNTFSFVSGFLSNLAYPVLCSDLQNAPQIGRKLLLSKTKS